MVLPLAQSSSGPGFSLPLGGILILVLLVATALLIRHMAGRLDRLPDSFEPPAPPAQAPDDGTASPQATP